MTLAPVSQDAWQGASLQHQPARIYLLVGEREKALDRLEPLLQVRYYYLSPGWLKIDPTFTPLRGNPRFEQLVQHRADGKTNQVLMVGAAAVKAKDNPADIIVTDANGNVVQDTKAERLAEHGRFITLVTDAAGRDALQRSLLASYRTAVDDPADEMVHLYEIRGRPQKALRQRGPMPGGR